MVDNLGMSVSFANNINNLVKIYRTKFPVTGVEFLYESYDPKIQKIEVLRLEKRLDSELVYLRDAEPEFSTFPFDMEPTYQPAGEPVPINPLKVIK